MDTKDFPNSSDKTAALSYRDAGVDIDAGNALVERIKPYAKATTRPGVIDSLGGFGALFEIPLDRYRQPVLVSGTDGVGTKLKLAIELGKHDTIGIDLVAMCVNDLIVQGAEPLFFLDYYASAKLDIEVAASVVKGIAQGCKMAGAALIGGETAEMPGMYDHGDYDVAGFCVGIVEKQHIIDGSRVKPGDVLVGIASSGPHSNGYSLIRKVLEKANADLNQTFTDDTAGNTAANTLGSTLLAPTRIYVKPVLALLQQISVHAIAHITGGGLIENLPRVLPAGSRAIIQTGSWPRPAIFDWLQEQGHIDDQEMHRTFNCGIGLVLSIDPQDLETTLTLLKQHGEMAWQIGTITADKISATAPSGGDAAVVLT